MRASFPPRSLSIPSFVIGSSERSSARDNCRTAPLYERRIAYPPSCEAQKHGLGVCCSTPRGHTCLLTRILTESASWQVGYARSLLYDRPRRVVSRRPEPTNVRLVCCEPDAESSESSRWIVDVGSWSLADRRGSCEFPNLLLPCGHRGFLNRSLQQLHNCLGVVFVMLLSTSRASRILSWHCLGPCFPSHERSRYSSPDTNLGSCALPGPFQ